MTIYLLQPPRPPNSTSGGYRYNEAMAHRLVASGTGELLEVKPAELEQRCADLAAAGVIIVLDSLYLAQRDVPQSLDGDVRLLLHCLPSNVPGMSPLDSARQIARERQWVAAVDAVITTSPRTARSLAEYHVDTTIATVVPGLDDVFRPAGQAPTNDTPIIIAVGTLTEAKGQLQLVRAVRGCDVHIVLIGDDRSDPDYVAQIVAATHGQSVEYTGSLPAAAVAERMQQADLLVSTSLSESYGMAVAEALACGLPVLAYRTGLIGDWVNDNHNGYTVAAGDAPALRQKLAQILANPRQLRALRAAPPSSFASWDEQFQRFLANTTSTTAAPAPRAYSRCQLPTAHGVFDVVIYRVEDREEATLISMGDLDHSDPLFVRVHSECFTGEVLGSLKCDCRDQLHLAFAAIAQRGRGAVVYLRQEGRGIGLGNKIRAYAEQDKGADTVEANRILGFPTDLRDFAVAAEILKSNGVRRVCLHTNNPAKIASLTANGIVVETVAPAVTEANPHNVDYLRTKHDALGHHGLAPALRDNPATQGG